MRRFVPLFALSLVFLLSGCLYQDASAWKRCRFEIASVQYLGIREDQTEWEILLEAHNPGSRRLKMERVQFFAAMDADTLATVRTQVPLNLEPGGVTRISLIAESPSAAWKKALATFQERGKCSLTVTGDAYHHGIFGVKKYPGLFHKDYEVDLATALKAAGSQLFQGLQGLPLSF